MPAGAPAPQAVLCARAGCGQPAFNGAQGSFCCRGCRDGRGCNCALNLAASLATVPTPARAGGRSSELEWCCLPRMAPSSCQQLHPTDQEYTNVLAQFTTKWDATRGAMPGRMTMFRITPDASVSKTFWRKCQSIGSGCGTYGHGKLPGNRQRRFHGSYCTCQFSGQPCSNAGAGCPVCGIIQNGFGIGFLGNNTGNPGFFGKGHYSTSMSSSAYGFATHGPGGAAGSTPVILVCAVAVGRADIVAATSGSQNTTPLPSGCHSRVVDKSSGVDELMVPEDSQMLPKYMIICG